MKTQIIVHTPDRKQRPKTVKDKERRANKDGQTIVRFLDQAFHLDGETWEVVEKPRLVGRKQSFITYHYASGNPNPLPMCVGKVPTPEELKALEEAWVTRENHPGEPLPVTNPPMFAVPDGMDSETVNALFTPWFYRQVTPTDRSLEDQLIAYLAGGSLIVAAITYWKLGKLMQFVGVP